MPPDRAQPRQIELSSHCPLAVTLAARMRAARNELTARWLERISARVALDPNRVFPTNELLDHVPLLIDGIAEYVADPSQAVGADVPVVAKARELGELRFDQGFDEYEILKEYELFGGVLFSFVAREVEALDEPCERGELLVCAHRIFRAVGIIQQASITNFLQLTRDRLREREDRLRGFNRAVTHELKNQIGAALGAMDLLELDDLAPETRDQLLGVIRRNIGSMRTVLNNLTELSRLDLDTRQQRHVLLPQAAAEVVRMLRDNARGARVEVRCDTLPPVEVSAAAVELCLTNLLSNAIKYADPAKGQRWVRISGRVVDAEGDGCETVVEVRDNGTGVPEAERERLFQRYFRTRGATVTGVEGTGLGLSIVRETVGALGGRAWAEFPEDGGALFAFSLPCRRGGDRPDAPTAAGAPTTSQETTAG